MTKREREGLQILVDASHLLVGEGAPSINAAMDWIRRQIKLDEKKRVPRGKYRRSK